MVPNEMDVRAVLGPFHGALADASRAALRSWLAIPPAQRAALDHPRVFANVIWGFFREEATVRLSGFPGVTLTHKYNTFGIVINEQLMLRFKRVNRKGLSRNYATQASLSFYAQCELPGIPATCPRAEIGWREDDVRLGLSDVCIAMRDGKRLAWRYSIIEEGGTSVVPIPMIAPTPAPRRLRVRGKAGEKRQKQRNA